MRRRHRPHLRLAAAAAAVSLLLSACGDDSGPTTTPSDSTPTPATTDPTDSPAVDDALEHPTGADDVVVEITYEGGFMPVEGVFTQLPVLLVAGDGHQYVQGPQIEIYPGPLLPNVQVADLGESGIQSLLALAAEHGLLAERDYESPTNVADAPDTVVTIRANGGTYVHRAYALGIGAGFDGAAETGDRAELAAFVDAATMLAVDVEQRPFEPDNYWLATSAVTDLTGYEIEPTIVAWPTDAPRLADDADEQCISVPANLVGDVFAAANQLTFFEQDGLTYSVLVKPDLPGDDC